MTKSELITVLTSKMPELSQKYGERLINSVLNAIIKTLRKGDRVEIRGFGTFCVHKRKPKAAHNPKTGETINVPSKNNIYFSAGKDMNKKLNKH